jgi:hypothetical protein
VAHAFEGSGVDDAAEAAELEFGGDFEDGDGVVGDDDFDTGGSYFFDYLRNECKCIVGQLSLSFGKTKKRWRKTKNKKKSENAAPSANTPPPRS